jgi:putative inorganic carbon (hco3(-)) transporter
MTLIDQVALSQSQLRARSLKVREGVPMLALIIAIAISATTGFGIGGSWFDEHRVIATTALIASMLYTLVFAFRQPKVSWSEIAVLAVLAVGVVSAYLAHRPYVALAEWSTIAVIVIFATVIRFSEPTTITLAGAAFGAIVPTAYVASVGANYGSELLLGFQVGYQTLLVGFSNPRFPAQLEALSMPFCFLAWRLVPGRFWKTCLLVVAAGWWMCLIGSGSRTSWIAIAVALALVAWIERRRGFVFTRFQLLVAASGGAAYVFFFLALPALLDLTSAPETGRFTELSSIRVRWLLWSASLESIAAHPWLGIGPMHYAYAYNAEAAHPHNFWLQLAVEWGLPVAVVALAGVALLWKRLLELIAVERDPDKSETGLVLICALTAWLVGTQADGFMVVPTSQLASAIILALCVSYLSLNEPLQSEAKKPSGMFRFAWTGMAALALLTLASLPFSSFGSATEREALWRKERQVHYFHPRFWQQGWIGPDQDPTAR